MDSLQNQHFSGGLVVAALAGASAIAIGAFGAHGLEGRLVEMGFDPALIARRLAQFDTGARYHLAHAVALLVLALYPTEIGQRRPQILHRIIFSLMVLGIFVFSGSLYLLVLTNTSWLGAITPIGGVSWIVAWLLIAGLVRK